MAVVIIMENMDLFLNVSQDLEDQTIKIKLDCVLSEYENQFNYAPPAIVALKQYQ